MSNPNYTSILMILDVSGSMAESYDSESGLPMDREVHQIMQDALHTMLEKQARKLAGYLTVDVTYFDDYLYEGEIGADPMTIDLGMFAHGGTQLWDNTAQALTLYEQRFNATPEDERPGHVVVVIMTDGQSSPAHTSEGRSVGNKVQNLIAQNGWEFAFLAADRGALAAARSGLRIPSDCGIYEPPTPAGIERMADRLGEFISMSRSNVKAHF